MWVSNFNENYELLKKKRLKIQMNCTMSSRTLCSQLFYILFFALSSCIAFSRKNLNTFYFSYKRLNYCYATSQNLRIYCGLQFARITFVYSNCFFYVLYLSMLWRQQTFLSTFVCIQGFCSLRMILFFILIER